MRTEEDIYKRYAEYVEKLATEKSGEFISNARREFASILMSTLFKHTKSEARIFCHGFKPDLIMTSPYLESLKDFLNDKNKKLKIMVETDAYRHEEPLQLVFNEKNQRNDSSIQVRKISEKDKNDIFNRFSTTHCNFSVFDEDMFRMEYSPEEYQAFASFNSPNHSKELRAIFDNAFESATVIA